MAKFPVEMELKLEHLKICSLQPGDVLVYRPPRELALEEYERIRESLHWLIGRSGMGSKVTAIVLHHDADLSIVRPEKQAGE